MTKLIAALAIACIYSPSVLGRPSLPPRAVNCSFNGARERCLLTYDSDGTSILVWPGGLTNTYDCGRYQAGKGTVGSRGKSYSAACYGVDGGTIYKTPNGITFVGE